MNVKYLRRMIREQIDRTQSIKDAIPSNPRHAALIHLATACGDILDDQAGRLEQCHTLLDSDDKVYAAMILKEVKRCVRAIGGVEGYGLPPLHCQSEQAIFLNDVLSAMHHEMGLRFRCPAVSCMSNEYYFTHLPTNTVYVPLSEATFLNPCKPPGARRAVVERPLVVTGPRALVFALLDAIPVTMRKIEAEYAISKATKAGTSRPAGP